MPSQLEMLKESLAEDLARLGPDAPFVKALQQQIRCLENRLLDAPQPNPVTMGKR
jgi:hypothetical protein